MNDEVPTMAPKFCPYCGGQQLKFVEQPNIFGELTTGVLCLGCKAKLVIDQMYGEMCYECGQLYQDDDELQALEREDGRPKCKWCEGVMNHVDYL